ncbi:MAG: AAA family ATPase [Spirochaetaceae bacterium]|nr:AAA family ATPase [Spirochaetaceae bacterium]
MNGNCNKCFETAEKIDKDEIPLMARYVPFRIAKFIGQSECCIFDQKITPLTGTCAYLDIVGFTHIVSEYVNNKRDVGELSDIFSSYYSVIIESLREFSGSVYQFAGDSLLIGFDLLEGETLAENFKRSFAAMYRTWELSINYNEVLESSNGFALNPKIGLGVGPYTQLFLGDLTRFVTPIFTGAAVRDAVAAEKNCDGQQFLITEEAYKLAEQAGMAHMFAPQNPGFYLMTSVDDDFVANVPRPDYVDLYEFFEQPQYYKRLYAFMNPMIREQIKNKYDGFAGDYRDATCVMVRFAGNFSQNEGVPIETCHRNFNAVYEMLQDKAMKYGVFCNQPDISDKGLVFPILFGATSSATVEDRESAACLFADEVLQDSRHLDFITSVNAGVASGIVYAGEFGASMRKDFTVVGNIINLAARLMMKAADREPFTFIADSRTAQKAEEKCIFEKLAPIPLKGFSTPQTVYKFDSKRQLLPKEREQNELFGRDKEKSIILEAYEKSSKGSLSAIALVGDGGIGKSFLVETCTAYLEKQQPYLPVIYSYCYQYEKATPFFLWRNLIGQLISLTELLSDEEAYNHLQSLFETSFPEELEWLPYVLEMMGFSSPKKDEINMVPSLKLQHFFKLMHKLLSVFTAGAPAVLVLEDLQWSDAVSLGFFEYLLREAKDLPLLLVSLARPEPQLTAFYKENGIDVLDLAPLNREAVTNLLLALLNIENPEEDFVNRIVSAAAGNPCFIEHVVRNLKENHTLIVSENGRNKLAKSVETIEIPSSIQTIILSRLNALSFEEQVICKTASVLGTGFLPSILREIIPDGIDDETLDKALADFETNKIISRGTEENPICTFKNSTVRNTVYDTILEATKKELNSAVLDYLEKHYEHNISAVVERLVYHSQEAKDYSKVFVYAFEAAEKAYQRSAITDSIAHYNVCLDAYKTGEVKDTDININRIYLKLANAYRKNSEYDLAVKTFNMVLSLEKSPLMLANAWHGLGKCCMEQGKFSTAIEDYETALSYLGCRMPEKPLGLLMSGLKSKLMLVFCKRRAINTESKKFKKTEARVKILTTLTKAYFLTASEKLYWSALADYVQALRLADCDAAITAIANFAAICSIKEKKASAIKIYESDDLSDRQLSVRSSAFSNFCIALNCLNTDKLNQARALAYHSKSYYESSREPWELMNVTAILGLVTFMTCDLEKSYEITKSLKTLSQRYHSAMTIGWALGLIPFMKYLQGKISAEIACAQIADGILFSECVQDHAYLAISYSSLAYIARMTGNYDDAMIYAKKIFDEYGKAQIKMNLFVAPVEEGIVALLSVLKHGNVDKAEAGKLKKLIDKGVKILKKEADGSELVKALYSRALSAVALADGRAEEAKAECNKAIEVLEKSEYALELLKTYAFACNNQILAKEIIMEKAKELIAKGSISEQVLFK